MVKLIFAAGELSAAISKQIVSLVAEQRVINGVNRIPDNVIHTMVTNSKTIRPSQTI